VFIKSFPSSSVALLLYKSTFSSLRGFLATSPRLFLAPGYAAATMFSVAAFFFAIRMPYQAAEMMIVMRKITLTVTPTPMAAFVPVERLELVFSTDNPVVIEYSPVLVEEDVTC
jgi:hypothetical protein